MLPGHGKARMGHRPKKTRWHKRAVWDTSKVILIFPAGSATPGPTGGAPSSSPHIPALLVLTVECLRRRCGVIAFETRDGGRQRVACLRRAGGPVLQWSGRSGTMQD